MKIDRLVVGELDTNCYVVSSQQDNAFIIDPGDEPQKIKEFLSEHKLKALFIVNTHGHFDHVGAAADLGLPVYIHEKDRVMISEPAKNVMSMFFKSFKPIEPDRLLRDGDTITLDELKFKVIHTPGHSPGSLCLYSDGVLFSGDTLFKFGVGRTDFPGANPKLMDESLKKLSRLESDIIVYPGHGPDTTIGREFNG